MTDLWRPFKADKPSNARGRRAVRRRAARPQPVKLMIDGEKLNRKDRRGVVKLVREARRAAARERDRIAARTQRVVYPGPKVVKTGWPTPAQPIGEYIRSKGISRG